jgi:putative transposase
LRLNYKYQLLPTKAQSEFLTSELKEAASLYNAALEERIGAWKICRKSINYYDQANQLKAMRADGCLTLANYTCCQDVLQRVDRAFQGFFRRVKRGEKKAGFPRYRSSRRYDSITFPKPGNGCRLLDNGSLYVQGAGSIKMNLHRPLGGKIKTVTIKREADRWFVCFVVECEPQLLPALDTATGVDVGLTSFAVLSDGTAIRNPRYYRKAQARLRLAQRRVARRKKGSKRRRKAVLLLERAHVHVRNQRADFLHKESRKLVNAYGRIAVEDLNVKGLAAGRLAKSVNDAGWSMFLFYLLYKAENAGRQIIKVDARGTSQTCTCGASVPKSLKDRWHECGACGLSAGRDHVSAQVILQRSGWSAPSDVNVEDWDSCVV